MKDIINLRRLSLLITREFALNKKNVFIMISSMTFVSMLVTYLMPHRFSSDGNIYNYYQMYPQVVFLYCAIASAYSFIELNTSDRIIEFIMLPSSTFEKYLTKFIYSTLGYILMGAFALSITSILVRILNADNPTDFRINVSSLWMNYTFLLQIYFLFHSIFFFGGVCFRKMELAKTFLVIVGLITIFYLCEIFLTEFFTFKKVRIHFDLLQQYYEVNNSREFLTTLSRNKLNRLLWDVRQITAIIGFYILPPLFWILSYLRLKENEVTDGV